MTKRKAESSEPLLQSNDTEIDSVIVSSVQSSANGRSIDRFEPLGHEFCKKCMTYMRT